MDTPRHSLNPAPRRAVVTGGAGFIGSHLVDRLLASGWNVTAVDCFEPFYPRRQKEQNIEAARGHPAYSFVEADTRDGAGIADVITRAGPSVVLDFAARAGVRPSLVDPQLYIDINVAGLQNTLLATARAGARFVFASSSSVYGADPRHPFSEDQMNVRPESPYAATKIAGEALVYAHHALNKLPIGIARLFTVFGPRQRPDLAIHGFARKMLVGTPIELYDQGQAIRDYTFVDDIVDGFVRLIDSEESALTVNFGSHRPVRTSAVVDELERALGVKATRILAPAQPGDVPATYADVSRARERLGWEPRWRFEDGIAAFCQWLRAQPVEDANVS
jgi:UDP-glucuronate 4-epimerase